MVDSDAETVLHADHESEEAEAAAFEAIHAVRFSPASPPTLKAWRRRFSSEREGRGFGGGPESM